MPEAPVVPDVPQIQSPPEQLPHAESPPNNPVETILQTKLAGLKPPREIFKVTPKVQERGKRQPLAKIEMTREAHATALSLYGELRAIAGSDEEVIRLIQQYRGIPKNKKYPDEAIKALFPNAGDKAQQDAALLDRRGVVKFLNAVSAKARAEIKNKELATIRQEAKEAYANAHDGKKPNETQLIDAVKMLRAQRATQRGLHPDQTTEATTIQQSQEDVWYRERAIKKLESQGIESPTDQQIIVEIAELKEQDRMREEDYKKAREAYEEQMKHQLSLVKTREELEKLAQKGEDKDEVEDPSRRRFLKRVVRVSAGAALVAMGVPVALNLAQTPAEAEGGKKPAAIPSLAQPPEAPAAPEKPSTTPEELPQEQKPVSVTEDAQRKTSQEAALKAEEARKEEERLLIEKRKSEAKAFFGGEERLNKLQELGKKFTDSLSRFLHLEVGNFEVPAAFVENAESYRNYRGLPHGAGRSKAEELQAEINKRLQQNPAALQKIKTEEDALNWIRDERLGTDCAGLVSRVYEGVYQALGLGDFYKTMVTLPGDLSATKFLRFGQENKGGFSELIDKAASLTPGTVIVFVDDKNTNEAVHAMVVVDVGITEDGHPFAKIAQNTDVTGGREKGAHVFTMIFEKPDGSLSQQLVKGAIPFIN